MLSKYCFNHIRLYIEGVQFQPNASTLDALIIQMQSNTALNTAKVKVEKVGNQTVSDLLKQMVWN